LDDALLSYGHLKFFTHWLDIGDRRSDIGDWTRKWYYILPNATMQCVGQTVKSPACPVSDLRCPVRVKNFKWP